MSKLAIAAGVIVAVGAAAAVWVVHEVPRHAVAAERPAQPVGVPVTAGKVAAANMPVFLNGIGTVQPYNMVTIKSRVDGQIVAVNFKEGQEVKAGAPLFQIDPRPYQATLEQMQAAKAKDQAALVSAQLDLERYSHLIKSGYQTQQSYDQQQATVGQLKAAIKGDQAQIDAAQLNIQYSDIRAPIDGRLGARLVDIGNMVHATDTNGLVTIAQIKPIYVSFTLAQTHLDSIRQRQAEAPLAVEAFTSDGKTRLAEGKLTLIDNTIDQTTGTIHLKATFPNQDERLWPGEFVNLRLILNTRKGVPTVPAQTVQIGEDGSYVYVIKPDHTVERRLVKVADVQDGLAVIDSGLKPGEPVVVEGQYRLVNGARVKTEAAAPGTAG